MDRIDEPSELSFIQGVIPTTLPIRVRIALPTLSFVVIWDFLVEARQNQRLQLDIHHSIPMFFSTTVDRRKASLIHRFTTERLWLSFSTRPMRTWKRAAWTANHFLLTKGGRTLTYITLPFECAPDKQRFSGPLLRLPSNQSSAFPLKHLRGHFRTKI